MTYCVLVSTALTNIGSYVVCQDIYWFETIMVNVYIKERINDQITICAGGVTSNTTYLGKYAYSPLLWINCVSAQ